MCNAGLRDRWYAESKSSPRSEIETETDPQREVRETITELLDEVTDMPLVGVARAEFLTRMKTVMDAKTVLIETMHDFSDLLIEFVEWAATERELRTDVRPLLRQLFIDE